MPRIHWTIPEALMAAIEAEADKRMKDDIKARGKTLGTVSRDIVIVCVVTGLRGVRGMNRDEIEDALRRAKHVL